MHAGHICLPATRLLVAHQCIDPVCHATHRLCHTQLPPPHCHTNQHHHCHYCLSHCYVIKTGYKFEPSCPLHLTNWQMLLFYKPACTCCKCSQDIANSATHKPKTTWCVDVNPVHQLTIASLVVYHTCSKYHSSEYKELNPIWMSG